MKTKEKKIIFVIFILILIIGIYIALRKKTTVIENIKIENLNKTEAIKLSYIPVTPDSVAVVVAKGLFDIFKPIRSFNLPTSETIRNIKQIDGNDKYVIFNLENKVLIYNQIDDLSIAIESNELNHRFQLITKVRIFDDKVVFLDAGLNSLYIYRTNGMFEKKIQIKDFLPKQLPYSVENFEIIENHCAIMITFYDNSNIKYAKYALLYFNLHSFESKIFDVLEIDSSTLFGEVSMIRYGKYIIFAFPFYETLYCFDAYALSVSIFARLPYDNQFYRQKLAAYNTGSKELSEALNKIINQNDFYFINYLFSINNFLFIMGNQLKFIYNNSRELKLIDIASVPELEDLFYESRAKFIKKYNLPKKADLFFSNNYSYVWYFEEKENSSDIKVIVFTSSI